MKLNYSTNYNGKVYYPGATFATKNYGSITILGRDIDNTKRFVVQFNDTGYIANVACQAIRTGEIRDPTVPTVCGVGYQGEGKYSKCTHLRFYELWRSMLDRCYSGRQDRHSYAEVVVDPSWFCLQTFCEDIQELSGFQNWYDNQEYELDKDLLGNSKVYSKHTCCFIPRNTNRRLVGVNA